MARYFTPDEVKGLDPAFVAILDYARQKAGVPFVITSGFRTPEENAAAGGAANSAHLRGLAVDLRCRDSHDRYLIIRALFQLGLQRIVVYAGDGHVHVDNDPDLPAQVFVVYP